MSSIDKAPRVEELPEIPAVVHGYAAVPLDLRANRQEQYRHESLVRIRRGLANAVETAMQFGWVHSRELAGQLTDVLDRSLTESHEKRIFLNRRYDTENLANMVDLTDKRIKHAMQGEASPFELLDTLADYPQLGSLEIAKLSHPLDFEATHEMDDDVHASLLKMGGHTEPINSVYKPKSYIDELPAMTLLRKQTIGGFDTPQGRVDIVRRQSFLVRGDEEACELDPYLDRKIRNRRRFPEISQKIENYLPNVRLYPFLSTFSSIATSYFAWVRKKPRS